MLNALGQQQKLKRGSRFGRSSRKKLTFSPQVIIGVIIAIAIGLLAVRFFSGDRTFTTAKNFNVLMTLDREANQPSLFVLINVEPGHLNLSTYKDTASITRPKSGIVFDLHLGIEELKRIIDAMGGIMINIPETIEYPGADGFPIRIDAGMRRLDADKVQAYFLRPDSPKTASLRAIVIGVTSRGGELVAEGVDLSKLLDAALASEDKGPDEQNAARIAGLLKASSQLGPTDIVIDWKQPAPVKIKAPEAPAVTIVRVRILNGIGTPRLAAKAAAKMPSSLFEISETGNADRFGYASTLIISPDDLPAQKVRNALGIGKIEKRAIASGADVEIILGADARNL